MPRDLTSEEAKQVDALAKEERPYYYDADIGELVQISENFETWVILTPMNVRARLANFFQFILDNDINNWDTRQELLEEWLENEIDDLRNEIEGYGTIVDSYNEVREDLASATFGFEDIDEINKVMNDLSNSVGDSVERRDSLVFEKAISTVLLSRSTGSGIPDEVKQEIKSWIRILLTY